MHTTIGCSGYYAASISHAIVHDAYAAPKTVAVVSADGIFAHNVARSAIHDANSHSLLVLLLITFPVGAADLSAVVTRLRAEHPDFVIESGHFVEGAALVLHVAQMGLRTEGIGETVAPADPAFAGTVGALAERVTGSTQWVAARHGRDMLFGIAADYVAEATAACLALVLAIEHKGSTDPAGVTAALRHLDVNSFFGQMRFTADGQNTTGRMTVIQVRHGRPVTVWPPDPAQACLIWPTISAP